MNNWDIGLIAHMRGKHSMQYCNTEQVYATAHVRHLHTTFRGVSMLSKSTKLRVFETIADGSCYEEFSAFGINVMYTHSKVKLKKRTALCTRVLHLVVARVRLSLLQDQRAWHKVTGHAGKGVRIDSRHSRSCSSYPKIAKSTSCEL